MTWKKMHIALIFRKRNIITCTRGENATQVAERNNLLLLPQDVCQES
jgi:hypothetical protein